MTASATCAIGEVPRRGEVTYTYEYDAYGNSFTLKGSTPNEFLYRGENYDRDLGLYYLRARYYNPASGRFMSRDPEDGDPAVPASLHKYLYADGDPVNGVDPMGRESMFERALLTAAIVGAYVAEYPDRALWGLSVMACGLLDTYNLIDTEIKLFKIAATGEVEGPGASDAGMQPPNAFCAGLI